MRRALWLNLALAGAVAALGIWIWLKPARDAPVEHALSALQVSAARTIRVERAGSAPVQLVKKDGAWRLTEPYGARADESKVGRLLELLEARASHRMPATDLARFELERPQARVVIDAQSFEFGMVGAVAREQYVRTGDTVYTVNPRYGSALPAGAGDLVSRNPLAPGEVPTRIELREFTVEQRDGRWTVAPAVPDLSQDDLIRWVENWRHASAARVEPLARAKPAGRIGIRLKDGGAITLAVLAREPELVLGRADEKLQYHFRPEAAQRLLSPPGTVKSRP